MVGTLVDPILWMYKEARGAWGEEVAEIISIWTQAVKLPSWCCWSNINTILPQDPAVLTQHRKGTGEWEVIPEDGAPERVFDDNWYLQGVSAVEWRCVAWQRVQGHPFGS